MFGNSGSYEPQMSKEHKGALYYTFTPKNGEAAASRKLGMIIEDNICIRN